MGGWGGGKSRQEEVGTRWTDMAETTFARVPSQRVICFSSNMFQEEESPTNPNPPITAHHAGDGPGKPRMGAGGSSR